MCIAEFVKLLFTDTTLFSMYQARNILFFFVTNMHTVHAGRELYMNTYLAFLEISLL